LAHYLARLWGLRYFWSALVRIDLRKRYRRSALGVGWSLLHPLIMAGVLCFVFSQVFDRDIHTFIPYLLTGLTCWQFFNEVTHQGCNCFLLGEPYIRQHPAPLAIYPLRATLGAGLHFLLALAVVLPIVWIAHGVGNPLALVSLAPTLLLLFVFGWSMALLIGVINVLFQDTSHLTDVVLKILFYATPVIYPSQMLHDRGLGLVVYLNPFAAFLDLLRAPILEGRFPAVGTFAVAVATTLAAATLATLTLVRVERRLIFYL
jgi:ABC-type polysaccharide/polyol phosphate export permease